ncbi:unnamed protein product [Candidula unifasciata]|uniref:Uncharacterized protein n=1 Tax=Candidula unifasciata TaxID=100452 RepID=A0A8S3YGI6_9EUPU|nr:unnamed protein product [Candidula unifasciata]
MTREKDLIMTRNRSSGEGACTAYVHSRITLYHASKIDLRYCRSLHSCSSCKLGQVDDLCGAIHFGVCSPVNFPSGRQRRVSGPSEHAVSYASTSPGSPSLDHDGSTIYHSSAHFSAPTNTKDKLVPRTRSLAILREGHELAGMHLDHRPVAHQSGLMRLHPQRQVVVQGPSIRIGGGATGVGQPGSDLIISSLGSAGGGRGGGVSISIKRGQTNISSSAGTAIKIQGQGHEIHIQGRGGQNIRVQPAVGHGGHVIRIHGQAHQDQLQYPSYSAVKPVAANSPTGVARSTATFTLPIPRSYSSTTQFQPQKPTARVAPAPVPPQICTPPVLIPATTLSPSPVLSSSCPDSPTCSQETPPFPVCSPVSSLSETPASSPSPSPSPPLASQIYTVQPPVSQVSVLLEISCMH